MRSLLALTVITAAFGCHQDNQDLKKELAGIRQELAALRGQRGGAPARPPAPRGPDPAKVYAVGVQGAPAVGPADAPVTIVMAYEYACPFCEKVRPTLRRHGPIPQRLRGRNRSPVAPRLVSIGRSTALCLWLS